MRALALLVILAACHGHGAAPVDAPPAGLDAPGFAITGREIVRQIANDAQDLPTITEVPRHAIAMAQVLPDGASAPVAVAVDGTFAFTSPAAAFRLAVTRDSDPPVEYQLAATHLDFAEVLAGRYDRVAPLPGTTLLVAATGATSGTGVFDTTGLWTQTVQPQGTNSAAYKLDWTQATSLSGPIGIVDSGKHDDAYAVFFNGVGGGYVALDAGCSFVETIDNGQPNEFGCKSVTLTLDQCVQATVDDVDEYQRLAAALPAMLPYSGGGWLWNVSAVPEVQLGPVGALWLAFGGTQNPPTSNLSQAISFADPFPGHTPVLESSVYRARTLLLPGTTSGASLPASTTYVVAPTASCPAPTAVTDTVAIAAPPALDGLALDHDGITLGLDRGQQHALAWDLAAGGAVDTWMVRLYQVTASGTQTQLALERSYITTERTIAIDPAELAAGQTYVVEVDGYQAYPNAAAGDFRTLGFPATPYAVSTIWSGSFEITD